MTRRALVVGAGPTGCLVAALLADRGWVVEVREQRTGLPSGGGGRSIALSVSPRGLAALREAGCVAEFEARAVAMDRRVLHLVDGRDITTTYGGLDRRNHSIARNELNKLLYEHAVACPRVSVMFGARCDRVDFAGRTATFAHADGSRSECGYDLLIGADGTRSAVRELLVAKGFATSGMVRLASSYLELTTCPMRVAPAIHVWPREGFFLVGLPRRDGALACTLVLPDEMFAAYRGTRLVALLAQHFSDVAEHLVRVEDAVTENPVSRLVVGASDRMHHGDSVVLVGDAAHTIAPFLGQGINLAFEDCVALADALDRGAGALAEYARDRKTNGDAAAALSMANYAELTSMRPPRARGAPMALTVNFSGLSYSEIARTVR